MGTDNILLRGNPAMDQQSVQGGVAILLGMPHAQETAISSGRLGLWLLFAFTLPFFIPSSNRRERELN